MILHAFAMHHYHALSDRERTRFLGLLDNEDDLLIQWLCLGGVPGCPETASIVDLIVSKTAGQG